MPPRVFKDAALGEKLRPLAGQVLEPCDELSEVVAQSKAGRGLVAGFDGPEDGPVLVQRFAHPPRLGQEEATRPVHMDPGGPR